MKSEIVNLYKSKFDIYIGRDKNSNFHYGNPFSFSSKYGINLETREKAVNAYKEWLLDLNYKEIEQERKLWILQNLDQLKNKKLGCFCSPLLCHGNVLLELIERL